MCIGGRLRAKCCEVPKQESQKAAKDLEVPLTGVRATATATNFATHVTLLQRFENSSENPLEAVYEFPVPPKSCISAFKAELSDGRVLIAHIRELERAKEIYDDALAAGHGAFLLEQQKTLSNIFSVSIGHLPPKRSVLVSVEFVTELSLASGRVRFVLPTQPFAPNGRDPTPKFILPTTDEFVSRVSHGLSLTVRFEMSCALLSVESSSHKIQVEKVKPNEAIASLLLPEVGLPLVKEFEITATMDHAALFGKPFAVAEESALMVSLCPQFGDEEDDLQKNEVIFLVDRSGSMQGAPIQAVKETLQFFLRSLPEGTLFNVVGFGSIVDRLFKSSHVYDQRALNQATEKVREMKANLGGTDIQTPLLQIFSQPSTPGVPRQIFLLTDGVVPNAQECIRTVRENAHTTRVFTFGIGDSVSVDLCEGLAEAGEGSAEFIDVRENNSGEMQTIVLRQLRRALQPALTDLRVDWGALSSHVTQSPYRIPPVFNGDRLLFYGLLPAPLPANLPKSTVATLHGRTVKGEYSSVIPIALEKATEKREKVSGAIRPLAARSAIRDLQENRSDLHSEKGQLLPPHTAADVQKRILSLSLAHSVLSDQTAFVAVEKRTDSSGEGLVLRKITIEKWRQAQQRKGTVSASVSRAPPTSSGSAWKGKVFNFGGAALRVAELSQSKTGKHGSAKAHIIAFDAVTGKKTELILNSAELRNLTEVVPIAKEEEEAEAADADETPTEQLSQVSMPVSMPVPTVSAPPPVLSRLVLTQAANGSFPLEAVKLLSTAVTSADHITSAFPPSSPNDLLVLTTAIICSYLHLRQAAHRATWELIVKKALHWLRKQTGDLAAVTVSANGFVEKYIEK